MNSIGSYITILIILVILLAGVLNKVSLFKIFTEGAKEGIKSTLFLAPTIIALITSVTIFKSSGAMNVLLKFLEPISRILNIPKEILPLALIKPISGSSSLALLSSVFKDYSPESFIGRLGTLIMASTETTFYVLTTYLAQSKLKLNKKVFIAALLVNIFSILASSTVVKILF